MSEDALQDAVDALTLPKRVRFLLPSPTGATLFCLTEVEHESLIETVREAIAGNIGSHAGGSDPTGRMPINADAVTLHDAIRQTIGRWYTDAFDAPPRDLPERSLREWMRDYVLAQRLLDTTGDLVAEEAEWTRKLRSFARQVTDLFDPPKRMEVTTLAAVPVISPRSGEQLRRRDGTAITRLSTRPAPCPWCEQATAFDPTTGNRVSALIIEYRTSQVDEAVSAAVARCRSCEESWAGEAGIRLLRQQIDDREAGLTPELGVSV